VGFEAERRRTGRRREAIPITAKIEASDGGGAFCIVSVRHGLGVWGEGKGSGEGDA
jgi:hypothetical protein